MPISSAKRAGNDRYNAKCDTIQIRPIMEQGAKIRAAAQASGQSLQGYILQACRAAMDPDTVSLRLGEDGVSWDDIKAAAAAAGLSTNEWIIQAIRDKL